MKFLDFFGFCRIFPHFPPLADAHLCEAEHRLLHHGLRRALYNSAPAAIAAALWDSMREWDGPRVCLGLDPGRSTQQTLRSEVNFGFLTVFGFFGNFSNLFFPAPIAATQLSHTKDGPIPHLVKAMAKKKRCKNPQSQPISHGEDSLRPWRQKLEQLPLRRPHSRPHLLRRHTICHPRQLK